MKISDYLHELFESNGAYLTHSIELWRGGVKSETNFWTEWFATKGLQWPDDYERRMLPQPLHAGLVALLPIDASRPARVLDVGAGPISATGTFVKDRDVAIVACDPLAQVYNRIIDQFDVSPPIRGQFAFAEDISARFPQGSFDVVTCTNALDHAIEPVWGILEMLIVAKLNGHIRLSHRRNEAVFEGYAGLHQWNFDVNENQFVVWNEGRRIDVTDLLTGCARVDCQLEGDWLTVTMSKTAELPIDPIVYQARLRAGLLEILLQ